MQGHRQAEANRQGNKVRERAKMVGPLSVKIVIILIIITTPVAFGLIAAIAGTGALADMTINVGSVTSQPIGASESISVQVSLRNQGLFVVK